MMHRAALSARNSSRRSASSGTWKGLALLLCLLCQREALRSPQTAQASNRSCDSQVIPHFTDITQKAGIDFQHASDPVKRYISESMSGGVLLLDYDGDGWLEINFTNAPTITMIREGKKARGALYRNNHDGTFTDVTDTAGVAYPCSAMGGEVGDSTTTAGPTSTSPVLTGEFCIATTATAPLPMSRPRVGRATDAGRPAQRLLTTTVTASSILRLPLTSVSISRTLRNRAAQQPVPIAVCPCSAGHMGCLVRETHSFTTSVLASSPM